MTNLPEKTIRINISGRVQGVYFRHGVREKAFELGITGTVENLNNGDVQIHASGSPEKLDKLVAWCWQGTSRSVVSQVNVENEPACFYEDFRILHRFSR